MTAVSVAVAALGCHDVNLDFSSDTDSITVFDDLYSIATVDDQHAVAVGYYGAVYYTDDGGNSWKKGQTDTILSIYDVAMADTRRGWIVGQRGLIMRTEDGGKTWVRQPNLKEKEGSHLFAVTAIDADNAWAIGEWGTRIRTTDGGKTWVDHSFTIHEDHPQFVWLAPVEQERVRAGEKVYEDVGLTDVQCLRPPSRRCWVIGEFGYVFYSENSGETWERSVIEGSVEIPPVQFGFNELELTEDQRAPLREFAAAIANEEHLNVAIESFASAREIEKFGRGGDPFELFEMLEARTLEVRTVLEDEGILSDRLRMRGQPPWDYEDFLEDDPGFLDRYLEGRRMDAPSTRVRVLQNPYLFTVRFRDEQNGLIAGLGGVILRSTDGGRSWVYHKIDRKQALFAARAVDGRAVAVGEKGLVRVSTDGGQTWEPPPNGTFPEVFTYMRDVEFDPRGQVGFIVGQRGQILRSTDAGFKWQQVLPPPKEAGAST
ncbi:MAG: YCF48-related protein [Myxococcota bacterium]